MDLIAIAPVILRKPGQLTVKKGDASRGVRLVQGDVLLQSQKNASASVGPARALHGKAHFQITLKCQVGYEVEKVPSAAAVCEEKDLLFNAFADSALAIAFTICQMFSHYLILEMVGPGEIG